MDTFLLQYFFVLLEPPPLSLSIRPMPEPVSEGKGGGG